MSNGTLAREITALDRQSPQTQPAWMLSLILDNIPTRVFWKDRDSIYLGCNSLFAKDAGLSSPEQIVGKSDYELPWSVKADELRTDDRKVMITGEPIINQEALHLTADGRSIQVLISKVPLKNQTGQIIGMMGSYQDITERRTAEEALRRSEEKYRELVQNANSIILRWGRDGTIHFFNEFAQTFFGYTEDEIIGRNVMGTIVPATESSGRDLQAMIAEILAHPESHETNINENMLRNGQRVWIAWTNKMVVDLEGRVTEILSVGLDITARVQDQQALRESETRYRAIFNSNADAFVLLDTDGRIVDANARAAELYGYAREEMIGLFSRDFVAPGHTSLFPELAAMSPGEWLHRETIHMRKDGTKINVEMHGTRLRYGGADRFLSIVFDVTERNKARESMQLFTNVVQNMQVGLYIYRLEDPQDDRTLKLTATNPASTSDLGISDDEVIGKYIDDVFPGLREHGIPQRFAEVALTGESFSVADLEYSDHRLAPKHYSFRVFALPGNEVGVLFDNITDVVQAEEDKRRFYRKTIEAATEGKLIICDRDDIEETAGPPLATIEITSGRDVSEVRRTVTEIAESRGMDEDRVIDFILCVGEAATNAIKHAHGGTASVHSVDDSLLAMISDRGSGIQEINLPDVALKRGYTTAISLGMGYKAMISVADKVYLATGPEGTTVAIKMGLHAKPEAVAAVTLPDTW